MQKTALIIKFFETIQKISMRLWQFETTVIPLLFLFIAGHEQGIFFIVMGFEIIVIIVFDVLVLKTNLIASSIKNIRVKNMKNSCQKLSNI